MDKNGWDNCQIEAMQLNERLYQDTITPALKIIENKRNLTTIAIDIKDEYKDHKKLANCLIDFFTLK